MKIYSLNNDNLKKFSYDLVKKLEGYEKPVFLCVGTDKFVCDSLAPIVGELLTKKYNINAYVYGGLDYNINGTNVSEAVSYIESRHPRNPIVLIDATLGDDIGCVGVTQNAFVGLGQILPIRRLGFFSILGIVGKKEKNFDLNSTRLRIVMSLARFISRGIAMSIDYLDSCKYSSVCN